MGGAGDLLSLALSVPPWQELHELSRDELRETNLVTTDAVAQVLPPADVLTPMAELHPKQIQDRFVGSAMQGDVASVAAKSTKTAEAVAPTGGAASAPAK
jgi:hypothetical protein